LTDTFKITAGVRVASTSYTADGLFYGPFISPTAGPSSPVTLSGSHSETPVTPKVVLAYQPDRDTLFYASAAKGFRVGGINSQLGTVCASDLASVGLSAAPNSYKSDSLWSYETGGKLTLLDRRLQINASLYVIDWSDIQQNVVLPTCGLAFVQNLGHARSTGGDIEVLFRPVSRLLLDLTAARTDAKYTQTVCASSSVVCTGLAATAAPVVSEGDRLRGAPWTVIAAADYGFYASGSTRAYVRFDYQFTTAQTALLPGQDPRNGLTDLTIPGLPETKNLSIRSGIQRNGLDISIFAQNLTDQHPVLFVARDSLGSDLYYQRSVRPLTIGLTATYRH
jgi:iron complex outermembrane receptor protein